MHVAKRVFDYHIVAAFAQQQADVRAVVGVAQLLVNNR
jgi:hypothetical protein